MLLVRALLCARLVESFRVWVVVLWFDVWVGDGGCIVGSMCGVV